MTLSTSAFFRQAFNHAWVQYGGDEARAFRVAWAAVGRVYTKVDGEWVRRPNLNEPV